MCDTQVLIGADAVWFAKNSDREPSEPQPVLRLPAVRGDRTASVRVTYIELDQVPDRHAVILSKPVWCWGAEMGVNDAGVCIGNEAVFTRQATLRPALLGMDLVRLGLERAATARAAVDIITALLERHGQGGAAGYTDKKFCYDSSFLIADPREAWVLESAGRNWAAKCVSDHYALSNALTLDREHELASAEVAAQAQKFSRHDSVLLPLFARASARRSLSLQGLRAPGAPSLARFAQHLRTHRRQRLRSNGDICMHAAGYVRRHQTTGSMIARLGAEGMTLLFTGTSAPCLSIFRPAAFAGPWNVLTPPEQDIAAPLWRRHELLHRWAMADAEFAERLRATRDEIESRIWPLLETRLPAEWQRADRLAASWHGVLFESLGKLRTPRQSRYWRALSRRDGIDIARPR